MGIETFLLVAVMAAICLLVERHQQNERLMLADTAEDPKEFFRHFYREVLNAPEGSQVSVFNRLNELNGKRLNYGSLKQLFLILAETTPSGELRPIHFAVLEVILSDHSVSPSDVEEILFAYDDKLYLERHNDLYDMLRTCMHPIPQTR